MQISESITCLLGVLSTLVGLLLYVSMCLSQWIQLSFRRIATWFSFSSFLVECLVLYNCKIGIITWCRGESSWSRLKLNSNKRISRSDICETFTRNALFRGQTCTVIDGHLNFFLYKNTKKRKIRPTVCKIYSSENTRETASKYISWWLRLGFPGYIGVILKIYFSLNMFLVKLEKNGDVYTFFSYGTPAKMTCNVSSMIKIKIEVEHKR